MNTLTDMAWHCAGEALDPFGRDFASRPMLSGRIYGVRVTGALFHTQGGLAVDSTARVLRPGGRFAYSVWHGPETSTAFRTVFDAIGKYGDPSIALPPGPPIHAFADPEIAFPALEAAGFAHPLLETVRCSWKVQDPGAPFDLFIEGTVRGALLLRSQPPENKTAIRSAVSEAIRLEFGNDGPWRVPIPAAIVSASG